MDVTIPKDWLPEVIEVNVSVDLVEELKRKWGNLRRQLETIRLRHRVSSEVIRIRDDTLLAPNTMAVWLSGFRVDGYRLETPDQLESTLIAAMESLWNQYADAIRFFAALHGPVDLADSPGRG